MQDRTTPPKGTVLQTAYQNHWLYPPIDLKIKNRLTVISTSMTIGKGVTLTDSYPYFKVVDLPIPPSPRQEVYLRGANTPRNQPVTSCYINSIQLSTINLKFFKTRYYFYGTSTYVNHRSSYRRRLPLRLTGISPYISSLMPIVRVGCFLVGNHP